MIFRNHGDPELAQCRTRVVLVVLLTGLTTYGAAIGHLWWRAPLVSAIYLGVSIAWTRFVAKHPGHFPARLIVPMACDLGLTAISSHMLGLFSVVYYPVLGYIVIANGVRYGFRYLAASLALGLAALGGVFAITKTWPNYYEVGALVSLGLVIAPSIYFALVGKLHSQNTELRLRVEQLSHAATHDSLTGLKNASHFQARIELEVERGQEKGGSFVILFIDLDGFKAVNDRLGHAVGDEVLRGAARCIEMSTRVSDLAARLGGDEFGVLLTGTARTEEIDLVCQRIRDRVAKVSLSHPDCPRVSASIGIARFPEDAESAEALMAFADAAMYQTKRASREERLTVEVS